MRPVIYFIQSGSRDFVKIGHCSGDPKRRLGRLQIGNPERLELVAVKDGGRETEADWHTRFAHLRVRGEWFRWTEELRDAARPLLRDPEEERRQRDRTALLLVGTPPDEINRMYERILASRRGAHTLAGGNSE